MTRKIALTCFACLLLPLLSAATAQEKTPKADTPKAYLERKQAARMAKATALGIDYLVGRLARDRKNLKDEDWDLVAQIAEKLKEEALTRGVESRPQLDSRNLELLNTDKLEEKEDELSPKLRTKRISADSIKGRSAYRSMIICKESLKLRVTLTECVLVAANAAQLRLGSSPVHCILIVNGDIDMETGPIHSIVIANGDIKIRGAAMASVLIARGKISISRAVDAVVREDARKVCADIGFFSPELVGLETALLDGKVRIRKVRPESAFGKAGLQAGDKIVSVDEVAVTSTSQFRGLLLEKVLAKGCLVTVQRKSETLKTKVVFDVD